MPADGERELLHMGVRLIHPTKKSSETICILKLVVFLILVLVFPLVDLTSKLVSKTLNLFIGSHLR